MRARVTPRAPPVAPCVRCAGWASRGAPRSAERAAAGSRTRRRRTRRRRCRSPSRSPAPVSKSWASAAPSRVSYFWSPVRALASGTCREAGAGERRLGLGELAAEVTLGDAHVVAPDLRGERAAGDRAAEVRTRHLDLAVGVADPRRGRQARGVADEPGVGWLSVVPVLPAAGQPICALPPVPPVMFASRIFVTSYGLAVGEAPCARRGLHRGRRRRRRGTSTFVIAVGLLRQPPEAIVA